MLKNKLLQDNSMFTVHLTNQDGYDFDYCYSGQPAHKTINEDFKSWANIEASTLDTSLGSIIPIDESVFDGFPQERPLNCSGNYENWTHPEYWSKKKSDYGQIKDTIDRILLPLKKIYDKELLIDEKKIIDDEVIRVNNEKKAVIAEENRLADIEFSKLLTVQEREDDRIIKILRTLGVTQQEEAIYPSEVEGTIQPYNISNFLMIGGVGLVLLLGLKKK
tara:strand:+ start:324 stop:983 length:660 start_codon:yes stop_codon:yes gene_type:complete